MWVEISNLTYTQEITRQSEYGPVTWFYIKGPYGNIKAYDIGYITPGYYEEYPDRLWDLYKNLLSVLDGHYHCCLSGKVWNF